MGIHRPNIFLVLIVMIEKVYSLLQIIDCLWIDYKQSFLLHSNQQWTIVVTLRSFIPNTFWGRFFSFVDILVDFHIQKWGKKKNLNPTMAFGDSQLASAADSAKICSDGPGSAALVSRLSLMAIVGFQFFFFPQFGTYE